MTPNQPVQLQAVLLSQGTTIVTIARGAVAVLPSTFSRSLQAATVVNLLRAGAPMVQCIIPAWGDDDQKLEDMINELGIETEVFECIDNSNSKEGEKIVAFRLEQE